jgi:hypothetical protein
MEHLQTSICDRVGRISAKYIPEPLRDEMLEGDYIRQTLFHTWIALKQRENGGTISTDDKLPKFWHVFRYRHVPWVDCILAF